MKSEKNTVSCYVASPLGFSEAGRHYLYAVIHPRLEETGIAVIDPWTLSDPLLIEKAASMEHGPQRHEKFHSANRIIGKNNASAIERCDMVIAILDGSDVDSGTAAEIGFAAALGKKILGYRSDFRLAGDNEGALVNLQVQYFIERSGGEIFSSLDLLIADLVTSSF
jgi:nucleoside 2-deoxyribosyltransferase